MQSPTAATPRRSVRAVVSPCRPVPSSSASIRVVEPDGHDNFRRYDSFTSQQLQENRNLALLTNQDPIFYLSHYGGYPGLIRGATWASGILVVSSNFRHVTEVCSSRVQGNKIKFGHGSEMFMEERASVWEWCVLREKIELVKRFRQVVPVIPPLVLERETETDCQVCYEPLTGLNVKCANRHQICVACFRLLATDNRKKCPSCNIPNYPGEAYELANNQMTTRREINRFFRFTLTGGNSGHDFKLNEAHFMGAVRYMVLSSAMSAFETMFYSSFFNFWYLHPSRVEGDKMFNVLLQTTGNIRTLRANDENIENLDAFNDFLDIIHTPAIYDIASHTACLLVYDDLDFYQHMQDLGEPMEILREYPNHGREIIKREIYFRHKVKHMSLTQLRDVLKHLLNRITIGGAAYNAIYKVTEEDENLWPDGTSNDEPQA